MVGLVSKPEVNKVDSDSEPGTVKVLVKPPDDKVLTVTLWDKVKLAVEISIEEDEPAVASTSVLLVSILDDTETVDGMEEAVGVTMVWVEVKGQ